MKTKHLSILLACCLVSVSLRAEVYMLRNGSRVTGVPVSRDKAAATVTIRDAVLGEITIAEADIVYTARDQAEADARAADTIGNEDEALGGIAALLQSDIDTAVSTGRPYTIAISDITVTGAKNISGSLYENLIIETLAATGRYRLVDRDSLQALLKEQSLSLAGLTGGEQKAGQLVGVDGFLSTRLRAKGPDTILAEVTLTDSASSAPLVEREYAGKARGNLQLAAGPTLTVGGGADITISGGVGGDSISHTASFAPSPGAAFRLNQRLEYIPALELSLAAAFAESAGAGEEMVPYEVQHWTVYDETNWSAYTNSGDFMADKFTTDAQIAILGRLNLLGLFGKSRELVFCYGGVNLEFNRFHYNNENEHVNIVGFLGGMEFKPGPRLGIFAEARIANDVALIKNDKVSYEMEFEPVRARFGVLYYFIR